ncbi:hypothetical protein RFI_34734, partial [Reticulomyxa filosa]
NSIGNSNVICSGSIDNTIRFWDIRSNKNELHMIKGDEKEEDGIIYKKKNVKYDLNLLHLYLAIIEFFVEQEMKVFLFEKFDKNYFENAHNIFLYYFPKTDQDQLKNYFS